MGAAEAAAALGTAAVGGSRKRAREGGGGGGGGSAASGLKGVLEGVGELWGSEQYDEQFDLERFLSTLK